MAPGPDISVALGSPNRHWTFDLGRELAGQGVLDRLYTMYPKSRVDHIPHDRIRSFPWVLGPTVAMSRLGWSGAWKALTAPVTESYDLWLSRTMEPCSVFHCISSYGLRSHGRARERYGALTVCDRGCAHIRVQDRLIQEERDRWGLPPNPISPRTVAREVAEYETCDVVVVPSPFARRSFLDEGVPAEKVKCVPFASDLDLFRPVPKEDDVFRVLYVGAISLEKGVPYLLQALASPPLPGVELWLVGPETDESSLIFSRFPDGYRYFGTIPRQELFWHYSQASVFVLPSVQDGFGMVMAQAMACGVPVIATEHTGVHALFEDGEAGFHVPIRDPEALREAVLRLQRDAEERDELGRRAQAIMKGRGGWRSYGLAMSDVYRDGLLARR